MSTLLAPPPAAAPATAPSRASLARVLTARAVADRMVAALLVATTMVGMGLVVGALWPPLQDVFADLDLPPELLAFAGGLDLATPAGWAHAEMLSVVAPAALVAIAVVSAGRATAGEEEAGTLGVLLSLPVTRLQVLAAKAAATVVHVAVVGAGVVAGLLLGSAVGGLGLGAGRVLGAAVSLAVLGLFFGAVALLLGSATGDRRLTGALTSGLAVLSYAAASFLPLLDSVAWLVRLSPWYWATTPPALVEGVSWGHLAVLAAATLAVVGAAAAALRRRDLRG